LEHAFSFIIVVLSLPLLSNRPLTQRKSTSSAS
jgi:hypothetical protein